MQSIRDRNIKEYRVNKEYFRKCVPKHLKMIGYGEGWYEIEKIIDRG